MSASELSRQRPIRSYVLREGRLTAAQQDALDRLWPRFGLAFDGGRDLEPGTVFGNDRPTWLEIGFGNGDALLATAREHPERNHIGVEVHRPGIGHLLIDLEHQDLTNVRLIRRDAFDVLDLMLAPACLHGVRLLFPDPWPKKRHHKRRMVRPEFLDLLARVLVPGGVFHAATDWEDYAQQILRTFAADTRFDNLAPDGTFVSRPEDRPATRFERRGQRLGHEVRDLLFRRRAPNRDTDA